MCECEAIISKEDPRYELWRQVVPNAHLPIKHPIAKNGFYEGDPSRLTEEQIQLIATLCSKKFNITKEEILKDIRKGILPIKAENVSLSICDLHIRCMV